MIFLHLVDDEKFIDSTIKLFEICNPGKNIYLVGIPNSEYKLKYIKTENVCAEVKDSPAYSKYIFSLRKDDVLLVHYLDYSKAKTLAYVPKNVRIAWLAYGSEFYNSSFYKGKLYYKHTSKIVGKDPYYILRKFKNIVRAPYNYFNKNSADNVFKHALKKIDYLSTPIPEEIDLYKASIPGFNPQGIRIRFGYLELSLGELIHDNFDLGDNIFIGNSNTASSNHVDVFRFLQSINCIDRDVIVPLSYGGTDFYRQKVVAEGEKIFGKHFLPILGYMDKRKYIKEVLKNCRTAILFHERQQGLGNVNLLVWIGAKVFLSENNPIYSYFKRLGIEVFSLQRATKHSINSVLSPEVKERNKELLLKECGFHTVSLQLKNWISKVNGLANKLLPEENL
jgi:hypothetical protein